ncbi:hypothetical protein DFJ73DRAFT_959535 [Zopfochytrium polystomum]|nr:hypothetical protein DFJ73DRAFT_959535 [Zopfochytrium polystomum]
MPVTQILLHEDDADIFAMEEAGRILGDAGENNATVKDLQDAINVSHPFGIKIWKPALYKKDRSINAMTYSALHAKPKLSQGLSVFNFGNILWLLVCGWWLSLLYVLAALVMIPFAVIGWIGGAMMYPLRSRGGQSEDEEGLLGGFVHRYRSRGWLSYTFSELARTWEYTKLLINLSGYVFWPFGKFIIRNNHFSSIFLPYPPSEPLEKLDSANHSAVLSPVLSAEPDTISSEAGHAPPRRRQPLAGGTAPSSVSSAPEAGRKRRHQRAPENGTVGSVSSLVRTPESVYYDSDVESEESTPDVEADQGDADSDDWDAPPQPAGASSSTHHQHGMRHRPIHRSKTWSEYFVGIRDDIQRAGLAGVIFAIIVSVVLAPAHFLVMGVCFFFVVSVPMAKLSYVLLRHLYKYPLRLSAHLPVDHTLVGGEEESGANSATTARDVPDAASHGLERHESTVEALDLGAVPSTPIIQGVLRRSASAPVRPVPLTKGEKGFKVILCTHTAMGWKYYKYTFDGINIILINLNAAVLFTLFDFYYLGPLLNYEGVGAHSFIFGMALVSVIPLAYLIGMAVSSITAQTGSLALGAVVNATFGSIVEIILYCLALMEGKTRMVEGSIIGSFMAGLLALPGVSMLSGGLKIKEQRFNAKAAGVTSTMLIMALIGAFGPTLFHESYGTFELRCDGCPTNAPGGGEGQLTAAALTTTCSRCRYHSPPPSSDPIYVMHTRPLMWASSAALVLVYAIGLWFTLRTHAKRIYSDPLPKDVQTPKLNPSRLAGASLPSDPAFSFMLPSSAAAAPLNSPEVSNVLRTRLPSRPNANVRSASSSAIGAYRPMSSFVVGGGVTGLGGTRRPSSSVLLLSPGGLLTQQQFGLGISSSTASGATIVAQGADVDADGPPVPVPRPTPGRVRAGAGAASSGQSGQTAASKPPSAAPVGEETAHSGGGGGHDHPNWSTAKSAVVLLTATVLYSLIAEVLIDSVDHVIQTGTPASSLSDDGSGGDGRFSIDEKILGLTLFALVPTVTEFYNAIAFARMGNIVLSLEIGSAYTIQVALLQIPVLVAFSTYWRVYGGRAPLPPPPSASSAAASAVAPMPFRKFRAMLAPLYHLMFPSPAASAWNLPGVASGGTREDTFTLVFPRWDLVAVLFSVFTLTYLYIEGKSNYFKGSMLLLAYGVLMMAFFCAPPSALAD